MFNTNQFLRGRAEEKKMEKEKLFVKILENQSQFKTQDNFWKLLKDLAYLETVVEISERFRLGLLNPLFFQKLNYFEKTCWTWVEGTVIKHADYGNQNLRQNL